MRTLTESLVNNAFASETEITSYPFVINDNVLDLHYSFNTRVVVDQVLRKRKAIKESNSRCVQQFD